LLGTIALLCLTPTHSLANWCELTFKEAASRAQVILLVRYEAPPGGAPRLVPVEVLRGSDVREGIGVFPAELRARLPQHGDQFMLALNAKLQLIDYAIGLGACSAISVLPIHDGKLRSRDRVDYDGERRALSLEALRADLGLQRGASGAAAGVAAVAVAPSSHAP
jgi:hypothetical protein